MDTIAFEFKARPQDAGYSTAFYCCAWQDGGNGRLFHGNGKTPLIALASALREFNAVHHW